MEDVDIWLFMYFSDVKSHLQKKFNRLEHLQMSDIL